MPDITTRRIYAGANFEGSPYGFWPPVAEGLEGFWLFGGDPENQAAALELSRKNHAPGKADATLVGAPVVTSQGIRTTNVTDYLRSGIFSVHRNLTVQTVARMPPGSGQITQNAFVLGAFDSSGRRLGDGIAFRPPGSGATEQNGRLGANVGYLNDSTNAAENALTFSETIPNLQEWHWIELIVTDRVARRLVCRTAGIDVAASDTRVRSTWPDLEFLIGANHNLAVFSTEVAFLAVHSVPLTDEQREVQYQFVKRKFARRPDPILLP